MAKKIKKQIKRSMPYFMIFSLIISSTVVGLVFSLNFNVQNIANHLNLNVSRPEVSAQNDTASTTVEVKNAPPTITTGVAETWNSGAGSTSTSPVNVGDTISFTTTAHDVEGNNYYLLICDADLTPTATNGGAPSCNGSATEFCTSPSTVSDAVATCVYSNVADPGAETDEWYAWVCDDHATQADCSPVASQGDNPGVAATSSPFYVNHRPALNSATTSIDNQLPGGQFEFTATSTDNDVTGGADVVQMDVCMTNGWATSTYETSGCTGGTFCTATTTASAGTAVTSCTWDDTSPTVDQAYDYYVFIQDWHSFGGTGNGVNEQYTIINATPVLSGLTLNSDQAITLEMKLDPEYVASTTVVATDDNGCTDLDHATSSIYLSTLTSSCSADDDNCYQIASANCALDAGSCTGASDPNAVYTCTTTMAFHAVPTDNSTNNPNVSDNWLAGFNVFDNDSASALATTTAVQGVEVNTLQAITITEDTIAYGQVKGGDNTGDYNATTTIVNYGNCPIDSGISGTDMDDGGVNIIEIYNQKYDLSPANYTILGNIASSTSVRINIVVPKPTTASQDVEDEIYWGIGIPGGKPSGNYSGTNTFVAVLDEFSW